MIKSIVSVKDLKKSYHSKIAVDGINFDISEGEILGLLGPNGAGKSTTINILSTILAPDSGNVSILGYDLYKDAKSIKKGIGIVPQEIAIFEEITTEKNVKFFGGLYGLKHDELERNIKEALELVGLYSKKNDYPKTFSGGMKRRLNIACALVHQPKLIIMDEPTVGIDPQSRNHILESIKKLQQKGVSVIYSTHYMEEVEAIADRIIIMNEGKIISSGTKDELIQSVENEITYTFEIEDSTKLNSQEINQIIGVVNVELENDVLSVTCQNAKDTLNNIVSILINGGCSFKKMGSKESSLETVFLNMTGRSLKD